MNIFDCFPGAIALAEFIAESRSIVRLDIRNNNLKVAGIMALQNALKNNYTLTRLDLDTEPKKEQVLYSVLYSVVSKKNDPRLIYAMQNFLKYLYDVFLMTEVLKTTWKMSEVRIKLKFEKN